MIRCCLMQSPDETAALAAVQEAFKSGVNFFDVAPFYASGDAERVRIFSLQAALPSPALCVLTCNQHETVAIDMADLTSAHHVLQLLGRAIKDLPRDQIIVGTKVGKYVAGEPADFSGPRVTKSVHESLERLQLKYIDLIQVHDIESCEDMRQVNTMRNWRALLVLCSCTPCRIESHT